MDKRRLTRMAVMTSIALVALVGVAFGSGSAPDARAEGAVVIKQATCFAWFPPAPYVETHDDIVVVITPSGNVQATCHFTGAPIDQNVNIKGFACGVPGGVTTDSHFVYSKSGHGKLRCVLHPDS
jgi:hypothetical protein